MKPALVAVLLLAAGCASSVRPELLPPGETPAPTVVAGDPAVREPTPTPTPEPTQDPTATPEPTPAFDTGVSAPNGRVAPWPPADDPERIGELLVTAEQAIRDPATTADELADQAHVQQVIYRMWAGRQEWDEPVFAAVPPELVAAVTSNLAARREFVAMAAGPIQELVPQWEIIDPEPAESLLSHYQEAEAASGIEWEYLAAINLVETGMGRIRGLSTAGARGPMQFIPPTWEAVGEGNIDDPRDSILAAGRYLVQRGGPADMASALFGYNPDENYVRAVTHYADVIRADPVAYMGYYHWEIYFFTVAGDVWLPVGYVRTEPQPVEAYLAEAPWSNPRPG